MTKSSLGASPKSRPMLFSASMIRALLDGKKSQTRRIIKPQPKVDQGWEEEPQWALDWKHYEDGFTTEELARLCPYGQPGDLLWVRETAEIDNETSDAVTLAKFAADGAPVLYPGPEEDEHGKPDYGGSIAHWWYSKDACPSIHLPRWASRLTLELTSVRVERLQDIGLTDASKEGCEVRQMWLFGADKAERQKIGAAVYRTLWESIYGPGSWDANQWVWVLEFRVHRYNVNSLLVGEAA